MYDESVFTEKMQKNMAQLDKLYLQYHNKNLSGSEIVKAKREYFKIARSVLHNMNERFDKMNIKKGDTLSNTEMILINHVQVMFIDMLASIHESAWSYGDEIGNR